MGQRTLILIFLDHYFSVAPAELVLFVVVERFHDVALMWSNKHLQRFTVIVSEVFSYILTLSEAH